MFPRRKSVGSSNHCTGGALGSVVRYVVHRNQDFLDQKIPHVSATCISCCYLSKKVGYIMLFQSSRNFCPILEDEGHCVHDGPWQSKNGHARACAEQRIRGVFSDIVHQTWSWESWWNQIQFQSIYFVTLQVYQHLVWYYFVDCTGDYPCFNLKVSNSWWPLAKLYLACWIRLCIDFIVSAFRAHPALTR